MTISPIQLSRSERFTKESETNKTKDTEHKTREQTHEEEWKKKLQEQSKGK